MTADAGDGKAQRLEVLKQLVALSEGLLEFVAKDTGVPAATVLIVMASIGKAVRLTAGAQAAAVYFDKPLEQVTKAEARAVLEEVAAKGDHPDRVWSAQRAALRQAVFLLEPAIIPNNLAGLTMRSTRLLDEGDQCAGMFTPAKRGRGRPGRSASDWDTYLMIEVVYTETLKNCSRDEAVTIATGVSREGAARHELPEAADASQRRPQGVVPDGGRPQEGDAENRRGCAQGRRGSVARRSRRRLRRFPTDLSRAPQAPGESAEPARLAHFRSKVRDRNTPNFYRGDSSADVINKLSFSLRDDPYDRRNKIHPENASRERHRYRYSFPADC